MGCLFSSAADAERDAAAPVNNFDGVATHAAKEKPTRAYQRPKWKAQDPEHMHSSQLKRKREEFWDTQPHYGGDRIIWDTLKAACEADFDTCKLLIESAGIIVAANNMTVCYDERGAKYVLPEYILSDPINLVKDD